MKIVASVLIFVSYVGCSASSQTASLMKTDAVTRADLLKLVEIPPNAEIQKVVGDAFCIELDSRIHGVELVPAYYDFALRQFRDGFEIDDAPNLELEETASVLIIPKSGKAKRVCVYGDDPEKRDVLLFSVNGVRLKGTSPYNDGADISYRLFECVIKK